MINANFETPIAAYLTAGAPGRSRFIAGALALLLASQLVSCAGKGPIFIEGIEYLAPEGASPSTGAAVVAVSAFRDLRNLKPEVIGRRQISDYQSNELVVRGTAAGLVVEAVGDALKVRGISGIRAGDWDLSEASINAGNADIVLGGEIKALSVQVLSRPLKVKYRAVAQLRVVAGDVRERKVLRVLNLNSSVERESIGYSDFSVRELLAEALSAAIDQMLSDEELKKRIH